MSLQSLVETPLAFPHWNCNNAEYERGVSIWIGKNNIQIKKDLTLRKKDATHAQINNSYGQMTEPEEKM